MIKHFYTLCFLILSLALTAQETQMADNFRQEGKIYVVIGVMSVVFLAIVIYLAAIDRKVKKLEEEIKNKK